MAKKDREPPGAAVNVSSENVQATGGSTVGVDQSHGKRITVGPEGETASPVGFLTFALKRLPLLVWAVGIGGIAAIVAIIASFNVPPAAIIFGSLGVFVGMFGLLIFAALVQPLESRRKPPLASLVLLWCFCSLIAASGFLTASSLFFDVPVRLRSLIVPETTRSLASPSTSPQQP